MSKPYVVSVTPDAEKTILYVARVSSDQSSNNTGLIGYLIRHKHWSPFEMAHMTIGIYTSRAIGRQLIRHPSFSFQELSQRYVAAPDALLHKGRKQATKNRQSSTDDLDPDTQDWWLEQQNRLFERIRDTYELALSRGIAKESARFILPEATMTHMYMTGNLRSWIHYLELRCGEDTQEEHRKVAEEIKEIFAQQFPIISRALGYMETEEVDVTKQQISSERDKGVEHFYNTENERLVPEALKYADSRLVHSDADSRYLTVLATELRAAYSKIEWLRMLAKLTAQAEPFYNDKTCRSALRTLIDAVIARERDK